MNNLYILTKQEFTSLYRFGQIPLNLNKVIETVTNSKEEAETKVFEVFMSLPYFVGDEEYLIISFENNLINKIWLEIENVSEIIPLTKAAKNSYQMKFDSKLDFAEPYFENIVRKVEEETDIQEMYRGAKAFWNLCKVDEEYQDFLQNSVIKTAYFKRVNGIKSSDFTEDFFIHLLAYDRYEFFPNTDLGFFYDLGEIFAHSKGAPSFKGSGFYHYLDKNKEDFAQKSFLEISEIISNSQDVVKFTQQLTADNLKKYIVAAMFLKFKADLADRDTIKRSETGKLISEFGKIEKYDKELNFAIYLTGTFFGYKKFYDDLYDLAGLKIFKKKPKSTPKKKEAHSKDLISSEVKEDSTVSNETTEQQTHSGIKETIVESKKEGEKITNENQHEQMADLKEKSQPNVRNYSGIQNQIFESLMNILEESKGTFEIKTDKLNTLKKILAPLSIDKKLSKKDDIVKIIKEKFNDKIIVEGKGKKYYVRIKTEGDLFANA
ncbi:MAG: hypothetical protein P8L20_12080 [Flavobacteriales bacterium]|nr:hypothetical protein [Flavobacteriales bacterium]